VKDRTPTDKPANPVDDPRSLRSTEENQDESDDTDDTAPVPNITRMPDGYEVVEQRMARATAEWVLQVRCQCGRRWFELEAIDATHCPRCGLLVYVDVQERRR
jgi:hypothetical protein